MATFRVTGDDTLQLNDRVFVDFADGDNLTIVYNEDRFTSVTGKNGNSVVNANSQGDNADVTIRLLRGSPDDRFLQSQLTAQQQDIAAFTLLDGEFTKRLGDGQGNVTNDIYTLRGGYIMRKVDTKENVSGDTEQGVSVYRAKFVLVNRDEE